MSDHDVVFGLVKLCAVCFVGSWFASLAAILVVWVLA